MFKTLLLLLVVLASSFATSEYDKTWKFDIQQLRKLVDKNIDCLENSGNLSKNATMELALAQGFLVEVYDSVPTLQGRRFDIVKGFEKRMSAMIENSILLYPEETILKVIWRSQYYNMAGDYSFSLGHVRREGSLNETLENIATNYLTTSRYGACLQELLEVNGLSEVGRKCVFPCENEIYNNDYDSGISAQQKAMYNGFQTVLNCTNMPFARIKAWEATFCTRVLSEVEAMLPHRKSKLVDDTLYYYLEKLTACNAWGFQEFQLPKYLKSVISLLDCDGCVGIQKGPEVAQVLTAQTLTILTLTLRNALEKDV